MTRLWSGGQRARRTTPKYRNQRTTVDGYTFDSKIEAEYYAHLRNLKRYGVVEDFDMQVAVELLPKQAHPTTGKTVRGIRYVADFRVTYPGGQVEYHDTKGVETPEFKIKSKLFMAKFGQPIWLIRKSGKNWAKEASYA